MKRITYIIAILFACTSCSDTFLDNAPKGKYHEGNYDMGTAQELLVLATLMDGYNVFAQQTWPITAMQCHTTEQSPRRTFGRRWGRLQPVSYHVIHAGQQYV